MDNDTGYVGWQYVEMTDNEKADANLASRLVDKAIERAGYDPSVRQNLKISFRKATLTISDEEAWSGAGHYLADGQPFYRMEISAEGKSIFDAAHDQSAALAFYLMQALGGGDFDVGGPLVIRHDFRGSLIEKGYQLAQNVMGLKPYVMQAMQPKPPSGPGLG